MRSKKQFERAISRTISQRGAQIRRRVGYEHSDHPVREARLAVARLIRLHRPRYVFTTKGAGVHPDHRAVTDIVKNSVFYARLPKWDEVGPAANALDGTEPHEIDRLFFARCRMEPAWPSFDFAVDISDWSEPKRAAIAAYESVFAGDQARLVERYAAEDQYWAASWACAMPSRSRRETRCSLAIRPRSSKCRSGDGGDDVGWLHVLAG